MASPLNVTKLPAPRVALIDPTTGLVSREWYRFFLNLFELTGAGSNAVSLDELQIGPPNQQFDLTSEINNLISAAPSDSPLVSQIAELQKQVQASELSAEAATQQLQAQLMSLANEVQALAVQPPTTPNLKRRSYGSFYDTTTQTAAAINTAYGLTFNSTDLSYGVDIGTPTSRVYVRSSGVYNIQFSAQLDSTSVGNHLIYIWLRVNGTDVANTAGKVRLQGLTAESIAAWNYIYNFKADDYFELMWSVSNTAVRILTEPAAGVVPAIPSIILTVTDNISAYQD